MVKSLFIFILMFFASSCCNQLQVEPKNNLIKVNKPQTLTNTKPFKNSVLIYGSSFGTFFQSLFLQNKFDEMIKFTSIQTIKRFGRPRLKKFYKTELLFDFELNKLTAIETTNDTIFLIYSNAIVIGTKRKIVLKTVVESDTARIVFTSLNNPF